jgi:hypothetical protein
MARLIFLDSGPHGLIVRAPSRPQVVRCLAWLKTISATGAAVIIHEIAHFEVRRELLRIRAIGSLRRLDGDGYADVPASPRMTMSEKRAESARVMPLASGPMTAGREATERRKEQAMNVPSVFISYSHKDEKWKNRLVNHLGVLGAQGLVEIWDDRRMTAGQAWFQEIQRAMQEACVAILMVSANSLTSEFILREEVRSLLGRRQSEGLPIIPLVVSPCDWQAVPWLRQMQLRPANGRPLSGGRSHQIDKELTELAREVRMLLGSSTQQSPPRPGLAENARNSASADNASGVMVGTETAPIEITIDKDFDAYSEEEQSRLLRAIAELLGMTSDVRVTSKRRGSVKLTLVLGSDEAGRLLRAVKGGKLAKFGVTGAKLLGNSVKRQPETVLLTAEELRAIAGGTHPLPEEKNAASTHPKKPS